jgi:hypothetical protein
LCGEDFYIDKLKKDNDKIKDTKKGEEKWKFYF